MLYDNSTSTQDKTPLMPMMPYIACITRPWANRYRRCSGQSSASGSRMTGVAAGATATDGTTRVTRLSLG
jgi:hypothetical protein